MKNYITIHDYKSIIVSSKNSVWDIGNGALYDLCSKYPKHTSVDVAIAKVWLIGRAYAAAIERFKNKKENSDNFYINKVGPVLVRSAIDLRLVSLSDAVAITEENILKILKVHEYVTSIFKSLTGQNKRSLSAKYLHFHLPNLFYIYDSRVSQAIRKFPIEMSRKLKSITNSKGIDAEYGNYFVKCHLLTTQIRQVFNEDLTPRQLDNFLIEIVNN